MKRAAFSLLALSLAAQSPWPKTVPEQTGYAATSSVAQVRAFMDGLRAKDAHLIPYHPKGAPAATEAGKPLLAWRLPATKPGALRVYLNANIHGGEVEGKEAMQELFRELLQGKHPELRAKLDLVVCPAYNADGTDAMDPAIRRHQPNPASGVGRREDARGLDLNRDLMKA
ncbi:MAG TPA: M14 family zinc carboxypeptidase, partial [Holophagaceae bacterium]|nr:M14 family zinc carboxypeptidase [Holophagaceae bacterium]